MFALPAIFLASMFVTAPFVARELESLVPQNVWPLPTYREMLFMK
jgi:ABC-type sulfate transport system permease subunit